MSPTSTYEQLLIENAALREENQRLRQQLGMEPIPAPQPPQKAVEGSGKDTDQVSELPRRA